MWPTLVNCGGGGGGDGDDDWNIFLYIKFKSNYSKNVYLFHPFPWSDNVNKISSKCAN